MLAKMGEAFPEATVYRVGRSYLGRDIWAMDLMSPVDVSHWSEVKASTFKPTMVYSARQHANEVSSTSHVLRHAELLLTDPEQRPKLDEEVPCFGPREEAFLRSIETLGWADAFRRLHRRARAYSWYSPNGGNGFRLDQAFLSPGLLHRLWRASYAWGGGRVAGLSDHAAFLVDLSEPESVVG